MTLPSSLNSTDWFVYIVQCSDSSLYTGVTNNLNHRIEQHNKKKGAKYTKNRTPVILVYYETTVDRSKAQKREYEIKQLSKQQKTILCQSFHA